MWVNGHKDAARLWNPHRRVPFSSNCAVAPCIILLFVADDALGWSLLGMVVGARRQWTIGGRYELGARDSRFMTDR